MSNGGKMVRRLATATLTLLVFLGGLWVTSGALSTPVAAVAGINEQINFQGRLFNAQGAVVPDGNYNIQFKIYQDGDGLSAGDATGSPAGSLKWTESWLNVNSQGIQVKNGYMSANLGSVTAFANLIDWNQGTLWLSMNIGNTNATCASFAVCGGDGEMVPMKRLSSTPYAMNAGKLGGLTSAGFIQNTTSPQTADFSITGNGTAATLTGSTSVISSLFDTPAVGAALSVGTSNATSITIGKSSIGTTLASSTITVGTPTSATNLIAASQSTTNTAGSALTVKGSTGNGTGAGGAVTVQGGTGGATGANGGDLNLSGGTATGSGVNGLVKLGASAYNTVTNATCSANCTLTQANVDNYGTVIINASTANVVMTLPAPTTSTSGRIVYLTTASTSLDFTLRANSGADTFDVAMRKNTTATMIWNGSAWTPGGASNATTLQATYANGTNPSTTPEIKLDSTRGTIDIQDADTTIGTDLLNIRGSNASGLGTVLFGVGNDGRVTIQGTTNQSSAFRVLDSSGNYTLNVNSASGYLLNNSTSTPGNQLNNPNFEAGGSITSGEEGWFGPAQASIVNNNANTGNYALAVTANTANMDVFAGTYYDVKPAESLYFQGYVKNSAGANGTAGIQITWYDKDKTVLSSSTDYASLPGTSYILKKVSAAAPANTAYARVSATVRSSATTGTFYFDDFYMSKNVQIGDYTFRNASDSTTAFRIQSAASAQTLFTADTSNNILKVGDSTGTNTATTILVLDGASSDISTLTNKNGGLYYNSATNSIKAVINGAVVDVCTTAITCSGYSASASSTIQLQGTSPGTPQTGNFNITGTGILTKLQTQDLASGNTSNLTIKSGDATSGNSGNLVLDVGTASGSTGSITIGHAGVATSMAGTLDIQGANALSLGAGSTASGSILFRNSAGANTITLSAVNANPTSPWTLFLPQDPGNSGDCLKGSNGVNTVSLSFSSCSAGTTTNLQDVYNNSSSPATITLADNKNLVFNAQDTTTDPSILFNLQCVTSCGSNGKFEIQNGGSSNPVFTVSPNGQGITLNAKTQVGSNTTDATQTNFQLDSYNGATDVGTCNNTTNQGSMYYNTTTGTIRACVTSGWTDVSNPEQLGLLSFGVVPQSGSQPYDLPGLTTSAVSGPCKVSWASLTSVSWGACVAYSGGQRVAVTAGSISLGTTIVNQWRHLCLTGTNNQPAWAAGSATTSATANMPTFSITAPILCIADVKSSSTTAANIGQIYDTRTFTSAIKEAVITSTAVELGAVVDSAASGALTPAASGSGKLYAAVVATDGSTSTGAPNAIVVTTGAAWVKAIAGTAGQFTKTSTTNGYVDTIASVPNNSFYYSAGNTRTSFASGCTSTTTCSGSLYVNLIVR
jgi:hypothetical protein